MNEIPETKQKTTLIPDPLNIPEELRKTPQWICWRSELKEGGKLNKIPIAPWRTGGEFAASVNDPANFTTFEVALRYAKEHPGVGVGFCFTQEDPYFGVDCDDCVNEAGEIDEFVRQLLAELNTYAEISPSGRGIKLIGKSREKPETSLRNDDVGLEIYTRDRFFTITGNKLPEAPGEVCQRTTQLKELLKKYRKLDIELLPGEKEENIPILKVLPPEYVKKMRRVGNHLRGPHPVHGSRTGSNFAILPEKNEWYCFRCQRGGGPLSLLAVVRGIVRCEEIGEKGTRKLCGEALRKTLEAARESGIITEIKPGKFGEKYFDEEGRFIPQWLADDILSSMPVITHRESWMIYRYSDGIYLPDGESAIREKARELLGNLSRDIHVNEVVSYIRDTTFRYPDEFEAPAELLCLENGILNMLTGELKPHTPEIIFLQKIPVKYDPSAKCPAVLKRLWEWTRDLKGLIRLIEWAGFCLYRDYFIRKALVIPGEGFNGKTTFINFLARWIGEANVASVKVQRLDRRFAAWRLYGKLGNFVDELPGEEWLDTEAFKQLTGGSLIEAEKKFKDPFLFRSYAKMLMAGNKLPAVNDDSRAFWDRIMIVPFNGVFENNNGTRIPREKILNEMLTSEERSGFLNLALCALKILMERIDFYGQEDLEFVRQQYVLRSDPVRAFAMDCIQESPSGKVSKAALYEAYVEYCEARGFPVKENNAFARSLKRCFPNIAETRLSDESGRPTAWIGIELKQPTLTDLKSGESVRVVNDVRVFPLLHLLMEHVKNTELSELIHIIMKELKNLDNPDIPDKNNKEDTPPLDSSPERAVQPVQPSINKVQKTENLGNNLETPRHLGHPGQLTADLKSRLFRIFGVSPFKPSQLAQHFTDAELAALVPVMDEMLKRGELMITTTESGQQAFQIVIKGGGERG